MGQTYNNFSQKLFEEPSSLFDNELTSGFKPKKQPKIQKVFQIPKNVYESASKRDAQSFLVDPRTLVVETLLYPYSAIGLVTHKIGQRTYFGTGFLISRHYVLTAAHNLFDRKLSQRSKQIMFWPGLNGPQGEGFPAAQVFFPGQYEKVDEIKSFQFDYGLLYIMEPIGDIYGFFSLDFRGQDSGIAKISGYPMSIFHEGKKIMAKKQMYQHIGSYQQIFQTDRVRYKIATSPGQSGSPIYKSSNGKYTVIGIHTNAGELFNQGILLSKQILRYINKWAAKPELTLNLSSSKLASRQIIKLFKQEKSTLKKVDRLKIDDNILSTQCLKYLANKKLRSLTSLSLKNNSVGKVGIKLLSNGKLSKLQALTIQNNSIGDEGMGELYAGNLQSLKKLNIKQNKISAQGVKYLSHFNNLTSLNISFNYLDISGAHSLSTQDFTNLTHLDLQWNNIQDEGVRNISTGQFSNLVHLNLSLNKVGPEGAKFLSNGNLSNLVHLALNVNNLGFEGCKQLANGNLMSLTHLSLNVNKVGSEGIKNLVTGNLARLTNLNLNDNKIQPEGAQLLAYGYLRKLISVSLNDNQIGLSGAQYLAEGQGKSLSDLNLKNNNIPESSFNKLSQKFLINYGRSININF